ncbi:MAG TPA: DUF3048 domain-containing protein [Candidatus Limnocylindrales bacterium]|nr:DUF3048 domain-containing protein [Candidatus Limnocylindrales bacterium]
MTVASLRHPRRRTIAIVAAALTTALVGGVLILRPAPTAPPVIAVADPTPSPTATPAPTPTPAAPSPSPTTPLLVGIADLTGARVADALAHRLPIAVLIDDNRVARPQSGFNGASLVYQAPADGGETRYMFVYQEGDSKDIGPVRSGRIYFVHWASEIRAAIGHYGGDQIARDYLRDHNKTLFTNVDALGSGARAYHRIKTRHAPHNGYTLTKALRAMAIKLGGPATIGPEIFRRPFVDASPLASRAASQAVRIPYRTGLIAYSYDRATNRYLRSVDGHAQIDPADGKRVTTTNVVILFQSFHTDSKIEPGHARPVVGDIGKGPAWVLRQGKLVKGTWRKANETATTRLFDAAGVEIPLIRGRTFFQIVPEATRVRVTS